MTEFFHSGKEVADALQISAKPEWAEVESLYPLLANSYYLGLIDPEKGDRDPIWRQLLPSNEELKDDFSDFDPLAEESQMIAPRLIRRFHDRAVVLVTSKCALHCRFCFRKRLWKSGENMPDLSDKELDDIIAAIQNHPEINEILLSGGDPAMLAPARLKNIISRFSALDQITTIRLGTRIPVAMPAIFNDEFISMLASFEKLWVLTHFNHPNEVTTSSAAVCRALIKNGIPVLNQCVLLKGVNDSGEILETLFRKLLAIKVKPHYLFHVDPVRGVRHFATGIEKGLEVMRYFRGRLSSLATPGFAIDLPEGGGKVLLQPDYSTDTGFWDIKNHKIINYPDKEVKK